MNSLRRGIIRLSFLFVCLLGPSLGTPARAWDVHALITRQSLLSFKLRDAALWKQLNSTVEVTPIEHFIEKAFGTSCTWEKMKDSVLEGVGRDYKVTYSEGITYHFEVEWDKGISRQIIQPKISAQNPQGVGKVVHPLDIISIYSDEPDWNMDDDVPQLRGKGISEAGEGTATRTLRHFWYENESLMGVDFGKDQETDRRAQIYYELSLIAFSVDEPYWGYRFLANALHYIQDLTQPFHTKALISGSLIDTLSVLRSQLCEWHQGPSCPNGFTLTSQVISNAWVVGAYHGAFEDFTRGLFSPTATFATYMHVSDFSGHYERLSTTEALPWITETTAPFIDFRAVVRAEQQSINNFATKIGDLSFDTFGNGPRYDTAATMKTVLTTGSNKADAYLMASMWDLDTGFLKMTRRQKDRLPLLVEQTHEVLMRTGVWGRQFVKLALMQAGNAQVLKAVEKHRAMLDTKCSTASTP